jgi:hypothetical protein
MSTWVVQVVIVVLFALACGALAAAWLRGVLGKAAIGLFVLAVAAWTIAFAAIVSEFRGANDFATCDASCTSTHYVAAVGFIASPLLVALSGLAMIVARSSRWRWGRTRENHS